MSHMHTTLVEIGKIFTEKKVKTSHGMFCWLAANERAKKVVVLVHGVTGNKLDMVVLGQEYIKRGYAVYAPDLPGHGSAPILEANSFDDLGNWLKYCIEAMRRTPDILIGNSFASAICYNFVTQGYASRQTHVILACPTPYIAWSSRALRRASGLLPKSFVIGAYNSPLGIKIRVAYLSKAHHASSRRWLGESEFHKIPFIDAEVGNQMTTLLETHNPYRVALPASIQASMTVIFGTKDNVATKRSFTYMRHLLPESRILIVPNRGHILHFEAAEHIAEAVSLKKENETLIKE